MRSTSQSDPSLPPSLYDNRKIELAGRAVEFWPFSGRTHTVDCILAGSELWNKHPLPPTETVALLGDRA